MNSIQNLKNKDGIWCREKNFLRFIHEDDDKVTWKTELQNPSYMQSLHSRKAIYIKLSLTSRRFPLSHWIEPVQQLSSESLIKNKTNITFNHV